jgi:hypothetical protein
MPVAKLLRTSLLGSWKCLIINTLRDCQPGSFELYPELGWPAAPPMTICVAPVRQ